MGSIPTESRNTLLVMKYFLPTDSKKTVVSFWQECAQVLVNSKEDYACTGKEWLGKLTVLNMILMGSGL